VNLQQTILSGIREKLLHHDFIVLPGFGGFVLKARSAHFNVSGGVLVPPAKTVTFNVQLKQNDGVLVLWLQEKLKCNAQESLKHLAEFADYCATILKTKRRLNFEGMGFFYLDFEDNLCFEPQADINFLTSSFGLDAVQARPVAAEPKPTTGREPVFEDRKAGTTVETKPKRDFRRLVAPVSLTIAVCMVVLFIASRVVMPGQLHSSLFNDASPALYVPLDYPDLKLETNQPENSGYVADANGIAVLNAAEKMIPVKVTADSEKHFSGENHYKNRYTIVLGCFSKISNARRMSQKLDHQGINGKISSKNAKGMYVVSCGHFLARSEALERLSQLKDVYPKAWIRQPE
jgi:nucleoid DNA-binding protein